MKRKILISVLVLALVLTATLAVLAGCNAKKHTVKFDLGELYTGDVEAPASMQVDDGGEIELPQLPAGVSVADHHFAGWKAANEDEAHAAGAKVTITADVTFIAQWLKDVAHVKFLAEDETVISEKDVEKGAAIGALPEAEAVFGKKFDGWYVKGDADKTKIAADYVVNANVEFLPLFVDDDNIASVTVKFMIRGTVQSSDKDKTVKLGDAIGEIFPELAELEIQNNELFVGWYLSDGSAMTDQKVEAGKVFIPEGKKVVGIEEANIVRVPASATEIIVEAKIVDLGTAVSDSIDSKYVGKWALVEGGASHTVDIAADRVTYTISQDGEDEVVLSAELADVFAAADGLNVKLKDAEEAVHVYHLSVADDKLGFAEYGETAKQLSFMVHVVFEVNGEQHSEQWVVKGSVVELPEDLDVPGMTFEGWHVDGAEDILSGPYTANADVKIVAKCTAHEVSESDFDGYWVVKDYKDYLKNKTYASLIMLHFDAATDKVVIRNTERDYTFDETSKKISYTYSDSSSGIDASSWEFSIANGKMTGIATYKESSGVDATAHTFEFVRPTTDFEYTGAYYSYDASPNSAQGRNLTILDNGLVYQFRDSMSYRNLYFGIMYFDEEENVWGIYGLTYASNLYFYPITVYANGAIAVDLSKDYGNNYVCWPMSMLNVGENPDAPNPQCTVFDVKDFGDSAVYKLYAYAAKDGGYVCTVNIVSSKFSCPANFVVQGADDFAVGAVATISFEDKVGAAINLKVKRMQGSGGYNDYLKIGDNMEGNYSFSGTEGGLGDITLDGFGTATVGEDEKPYSYNPVDDSIAIDGVFYDVDKAASTYDLKPADALKDRVFNAKHSSQNDYWELTFDGYGGVSVDEWYNGSVYVNGHDTTTYVYDAEANTVTIASFGKYDEDYGKVVGTFTVDLEHNVLINEEDQMAWLEGVATEAHPEWAYVPASPDGFLGYWTEADNNIWIFYAAGKLQVKMSMETTDYQTVNVIPGGKTMIMWRYSYSSPSTDYELTLDDSDPENLKLSVKKGSGDATEFAKAGDAPEFEGFVDTFLSGAFETGDGMSLTFEEKTLKIDGTEVSGLFAFDVDYSHINCKQFHFTYDGKGYYIQKGIYDKSAYRYAQNEYYIFEEGSDNGKLLFKTESAPAIPAEWYGEYNGKLDQNDIKIVIDASGVKFNDKAVSKTAYFAKEASYDNPGHSREGIGFYIAKAESEDADEEAQSYEGDFALVKDSALGSSMFDFHLYLFMSVDEKRDINVTKKADAIEEPDGFDIVGTWYFGQRVGTSSYTYYDYYLTFSKTTDADAKLQVKLGNGTPVDVELPAATGRWKFSVNGTLCEASVNADGTITIASGTYAGTYKKGDKPEQATLDANLVAIGNDLVATATTSSYTAAKSVKIESNKITVVIAGADESTGDTTLTSYSISDHSQTYASSDASQIKYYVVMDDFSAWELYIDKTAWVEGAYDKARWTLEGKSNGYSYNKMYVQKSYEEVTLTGTYKFSYTKSEAPVEDHIIFLADGTVAIHSEDSNLAGLYTYQTVGKDRITIGSYITVDKQSDGKLSVVYKYSVTTYSGTAEVDSAYSIPNSELGAVTYLVETPTNVSASTWSERWIQKVEINWALMAITVSYSSSKTSTNFSTEKAIYVKKDADSFSVSISGLKKMYFKLNEAKDTITLFLDEDNSQISVAKKEIEDPNAKLGTVEFEVSHAFPGKADSLDFIIKGMELNFAEHTLDVTAIDGGWDSSNNKSGLTLVYDDNNKYTVKGEDFYLVYADTDGTKTLTVKLVDGDVELGKLYEKGKAPEYVDPTKSLPKTKYTAAQPIDSTQQESGTTKFLIKYIEVDWANSKATLGYAYGNTAAEPAPEDKTLEVTLTAKECFYNVKAVETRSDLDYSKSLNFMLVGEELKVFARATYLGSAKAAGAEEELEPTEEHSLYDGIFRFVAIDGSGSPNVTTSLKFVEDGNACTITSSSSTYQTTFTYNDGDGTVNIVEGGGASSVFTGDYTFDKATGELKHSTNNRIYKVLGKDQPQVADLEGKSFAYSPRNFAFKATGEGDYTSASGSSTFKWEIVQNDSSEWVVRISENSNSIVNGDYYLFNSQIVKDSTFFALVEA